MNARLLASVLAIFALFHLLAARLGSMRGEAGLAVSTAVVLAIIAAQAMLFGQRPRQAVAWLGLGRPTARSLIAAGVVSVALVAVIPIFGAVRHVSFAWYPGWLWLLPGLFAQGGIAEETLFRGYLFQHVREGRSFWRGVAVSLGPFVAAHIVLFGSMEWPVALAAVLLSVAVSPPLAWLFEIGGRTIWAPAVLHFVIQSALKVVEWPEGDAARLPIVWMAACATVPYLVFLVRPRA